ncbi:MAG: efflux RND transporter periplasmic adaptor subunit [Akkermansiaceae bacterium]
MPDTTSDPSVLTRSPAPPGASRRRAAALLPIAILTGFAFLFLLLYRDRLIPAKDVQVSPARAIENIPDPEAKPNTPPASGRLLFQASGWIEPDPLPLKVTALTDGVIDQVHVLEGQLVKKGELLATLVEIDSKLAMDLAGRETAVLKASLEAHCMSTQIASQQMAAEKAGLISDEADATEATDLLRRIELTPDRAISENDRITARLGKSRSQAAFDGRKARIEEISHEITRISHEVTALEQGIQAAEIKLAQATLAHERTRITAPADGRVLRLLAAPGQKKMIAMDDVDSATIAILYDPAKLQVRVDVPLADAVGLSVGQRAKVRCNLLPDVVFEGEVTRINGEADLQRNTLQAKVRISNPHEKLRPEMLCRVEFLDTATVGQKTASDGNLSVFVPESALREQAVWICDPDSRRVSRRSVDPSNESRDGQRRLNSGVRPGEWIVLDPSGLRENQRVNPIHQP